jgi:hypothetical protein
MMNRKKRDLNSTNENKAFQPIVEIGPHMLSFIDKRISEKLEINAGDFCEQSITADGALLPI